MNRDPAIISPCTRCGAPPWKTCRTEDGAKLGYSHPVRIELSVRARIAMM